MTLHWTSFARSGLCAVAVMGAALVQAQTAPVPAHVEGVHAPQQVHPQHPHPHHPAKKSGVRHHGAQKAGNGKYANPHQHEAAAVEGERRKGVGPANPHGAQLSEFERNALRRCDVFKTQDDRRACVERVRQPQISGSVQGGGVLREYTQTIQIPAQPAAPAQPHVNQPGQHPHLVHPPVQPIRQPQ